MNNKRLFTVKEANKLIPFLNTTITSLRRVNDKLEMASLEGPTEEDITLLGGVLVNRNYIRLLTRFQSLTDEIHAEGCRLKAVGSGLVDFPTVWEGREVYLCWQFGEAEIQHWHELEAGFTGRHPLQHKTID